MHWPRIHDLAASDGVWLQANETDKGAILWALAYFIRSFTLSHIYRTTNRFYLIGGYTINADPQLMDKKNN